jgi:hypothetical protein
MSDERTFTGEELDRLVQLVRVWAAVVEFDYPNDTGSTARDAADAIAFLRAEVERLRATLQHFAREFKARGALENGK